MHITLDSVFCLAKAPWLSWRDIDYGFENDFLTAEEVIGYAVKKLSLESSEEHYILACLVGSDKFAVKESVSYLASKEPSVNIDLGGVWIYLVLSWVFANKHKFPNPMAIIEELYADFDYPEFLEPTIRYMPTESSSLQGEDYLLENFSNILDAYGTELRRSRSV
nr:DUF2247 family protein [uncultured Pseudomonas sp.]